MPERRKILQGAFGHVALLCIDFLVLVGIIESFQLFTGDLPFLNTFVLGYMLVHTFMLLSIQLGIQILQLIHIRMPSFLISYYFQIDDDEVIPIPILDPTKSKLAVIIILLVITGGPILYPIFAIYGFLLIYAIIIINPIGPSTILTYFELFLNWMPITIAIIVGTIILSIVAVEFKHL